MKRAQRRAPTARKGARPSRRLAGVVAAGAAVVVVHVVSARDSLSWMWGTHFYAFYPGGVALTATLFAAVLLAAIVIRRDAADALVQRLEGILAGRRWPAVVGITLLAGVALFWFARISHTYLGDGNVIVQEIDHKKPILEREPLTSLLHYAVYAVTRPWFEHPGRRVEAVSHDAVAVGSVLAGLLFLVVAWQLAHEIARLAGTERKRSLTALVWLTVVTQGYVQLFFGYVENYSFQAVGVTLFLWLCLRHARGAAPLLYPGLALILCLALHLSSMVLAAPFVVLAAAALIARESRRGAVRDVALLVIAGAGAVASFMRLIPDYNPMETLRSMVGAAFMTSSNQAYMFSRQHYRDFLNEQLLIGPLGLFLFLPAAVTALWQHGAFRRPAVLFALAAGAAVLATSWTFTDSNLGYARDWDLLAHSGMVFTVSGLALFALYRPRSQPGNAEHGVLVAALSCFVVMSVYHTAPWIGVNASESRSLARLQTLPLGGGRTEVLVSSWYRVQGDDAGQREWLQRAIRKYPTNFNAHLRLGTMEMDARNYEAAATSFAAAVSLRQRDPQFRNYVVSALRAQRKFSETVPHLEIMLNANPGDVFALIFLGEAYESEGRTALAEAAFTSVETMARSYVVDNKDDSGVLAAYGWSLHKLGRPKEAIPFLREALAAKRPAAVAHCYLGIALEETGDTTAALNEYRECLATTPYYPDHETMAARLAGAQPTAP